MPAAHLHAMLGMCGGGVDRALRGRGRVSACMLQGAELCAWLGAVLWLPSGVWPRNQASSDYLTRRDLWLGQLSSRHPSLRHSNHCISREDHSTAARFSSNHRESATACPLDRISN